MTWLTGEPAEMWDAARTTTDAPLRRRVLNYWARNLATLPGPLFFELEPGQVLRGEWERAVRMSEPRCPCAARRWFIPTHSQPFHAADEPELFTLGAGRPQIAITPWGGDTVASLVQLSVNDGHLVERQAPYSQLSQAQLREIGFGTLGNMEHTDGSMTGTQPSNLEVRTPLAEIAQQFSPPFMAVPLIITVGAADSTDMFSFRSFAIYGVDTENGTVTVGISRNCQQADPADRARIHVCA